MRINNEIINIDYKSTKSFFERRMNKYNDNNPYSLTMYQDEHPELVFERNQREIDLIKPYLRINSSTKILDIACGIGRWSDAIHEQIMLYCGLDYCEGFINLAKKRNEQLNNRLFYVADGTKISDCLSKNMTDIEFNVVLMMGFLMYLNEDDLIKALSQIPHLCEAKSIICVREPIGINNRLTLKDFYSSELKDEYNVIYRTRDELYASFEGTVLNRGFRIIHEGYMFDDKQLNNRKETAQYYFVMERS